jgi:hypothetical protein
MQYREFNRKVSFGERDRLSPVYLNQSASLTTVALWLLPPSYSARVVSSIL